MKTTTTACLFLFLTSVAWAQPPEGLRGRGGPGGPGGPPNPGDFLRMMPITAALDVDEDGEISADEIENATQALKQLDKNDDGKLTFDELRPDFGRRGFRDREGDGRQARRGRDPRERINRLMQSDQNGDGKLSEDEVPERMRRLFGRADGDQDGEVTKEELTKFFSDNGRRAGDERRRGRDAEEGGGERPRRPKRPE